MHFQIVPNIYFFNKHHVFFRNNDIADDLCYLATAIISHMQKKRIGAHLVSYLGFSVVSDIIRLFYFQITGLITIYSTFRMSIS